MSGSDSREILNIEEAAQLLGVSIKTFNKVLHNEGMPARKIGREWKFSRQALIDWVGAGSSADFYRESDRGRSGGNESADGQATGSHSSDNGSRRTRGWKIELD